MTHPFNWSLFDRMPVVGIMRHFPPKYLDPIARVYFDAGFSTLEITMNTAGAAATIRHLRTLYGERVNIGAGTVLTDEDLELALEAGAQFIVTPVVVKSVIKTCKKRGIPVFPGAMTPTEIYKAWSYGAAAVKVFPAGKLGPGYIKDVLEPLNGIKLIPTGGISPENFTEFLGMGAIGVGMASALFPRDLIAGAEENPDRLMAFYTRLVQQYQTFKTPAQNHG